MAQKNKIKIGGKTFNVGKKLGAGELQRIANKTGYTPESVLSRVQNKGVKVASSASNYVSSRSNNTSTGGGGNTSSGGGGYSGGGTSGGATSPFDFGSLFQDVIAPFQIDLANIQGGYATQVANIQAGATTQAASIRGEADKEVARAYADAQKYGAQLGLEGTKYASDKESEWRQAVANIEVKGKLDLQPIINAGLERVAGIEAQAQRDVAETTGKYSLASTKEQTATQERLGKMELAGSMYGLLGAAFG